ncbi:MAG: immunoglobulin domain-containing protein [Opitutaceae bacterium]
MSAQPGGGSDPSVPTITYVYYAPVLAVGSSRVFSVNVSGTAPFTYQWRKDGQDLPGATTANLVLANVQPSHAGLYTVSVSNFWGSVTSSNFRLTVLQNLPRGIPIITQQPELHISGGGFAGMGTAVLQVVAVSATPMSYVWYKNGQRLPDGIMGSINLYIIGELGFTGRLRPNAAGDYWVEISNDDGLVLSDIVKVIYGSELSIIAPPLGQTVMAGANVSFTVLAEGAPPLTFAWRRNGLPVDRTGPILNLTNVQPGDAGDYTVTVTDATGSVTSPPATLVVNVPAVAPVISVQPVSQMVMAGGPVVFSVTATGTAPLSYEWSKEGVFLVGATVATLTLNSVQAGDAGTYSVRVNNSAGNATSNPVTLTVNQPVTAPVILTQPATQSVRVGDRVELSVVAAGTAPLSYQWRQGGSVIAGATGSTFVIPSVQLTDGGAYAVTVSNSLGSIVSQYATLTVLPPQVAPVIVAQPVSRTARVGDAVSFEVVAVGTNPLSYTWKRSGVTVSGAAGATLNLPSVQMNDGGDYAVTVSNSLGSVTSAVATLVVQPALLAPVITEKPVGRTLPAGARLELKVVATGSAPLVYEWRRDDLLIPGETGPTLTREPVQMADGGQYQVRVTNAAGTVLSERVVVTVLPAPTSRISNVSVRTILAAEQRLIVGVTMTGGPKPVLVRAIGPGLVPFGVTDAMPDPAVTLFSGGTEGAKNDNWGGGAELQAAFASVGAFALPVTSLDAAMLSPIEGGRTVQVWGPVGGTVLVEAYDAGGGDSPRFTNVSARNRLTSVNDRLIAGFTLAGAAAKTVLIRAAGPTLGSFGVAGALGDPRIEVYAGAVRMAESDDWAGELASTFDALGAFRFGPGSKDAALLLTLQPGGYTVQVSGTGAEGGEVLFELYEVQSP